MAMQPYPIKKFGSKLMVASKAINTIPDHFLSYSRNARIFDGGIGPRRGKQLLTNSVLGTNNKGGFVMNDKLYQVANGKIYEINETTGVQTEKASLGYDTTVDILVYGTNIALIASNGQPLKLYDGVTTVTSPGTAPSNTGILEYCRSYSFMAAGNILYISRPITPANPGYAYDFTGTGSQQITYDSNITALKSTLNGLYVITEDKVEYLGANSLQNVAGAAAFISTPLGEGSQPVSNLNVVASGDNIYYITKNLQVQKISFMNGTNAAALGELSARPVVSIKEFLNTLNLVQTTSFGFFNQTDKTVQFHIRSAGTPYNDYVLVYDEVNDTWNVDTQKHYNYVVKKGEKYYGFSDVNTSIYLDDVGFSDAGSAIEFRIDTQNMSQGTPNQKIYEGLYLMGGIGINSQLQISVNIDNDQAFIDVVNGNTNILSSLGEIGGAAIGDEPIAGELFYNSKLNPFDRRADVGRMYQGGKRIQMSIRSASQIQDFILDSAGFFFEPTNFIDLPEVW